jgi:hypothetical protein
VCSVGLCNIAEGLIALKWREAGGHTCAKRRRPDLTLSHHFSTQQSGCGNGGRPRGQIICRLRRPGVRWSLILIAAVLIDGGRAKIFVREPESFSLSLHPPTLVTCQFSASALSVCEFKANYCALG